MSIPLSKEHGINPALTNCPRCGGEAEELVLAGNSIKWECDDCKRMHVAYAGRRGKMVCPCGNKHHFTKVGKFDGTRDRAVASQPCKKCEEEIETHHKLVEEGGVYWRCSDCASEGVIRPEAELAKAVREKHGIDPPEPCGVEFSKDWGCPACVTETASGKSGWKEDGEGKV